ncbi:MAG: thaumatin family protein [Legionellales bacterium]|jgi:hypothetical protein
MKKIKYVKIILSLVAVSFTFIALAQSTAPGTQSETLSLNVQPTSITVSYGAVNQQIPVSFYIVNNATYAQNLNDYQLTATNPPGDNPISVGQFTDTCNGQIPAQGSSGVCSISTTITATNPGTDLAPINYTFSLEYGAGREDIPLTSDPFPIAFATGEQTGSREFTFINNCDQDIYVGISSGATNPQNTPYVPGQKPPACSTDTTAVNACFPGSTCSTAVSPNVCFWNNPTPEAYYLPAFTGTGEPASTTATFAAYDNGVDLVWNGSIAGRTGCNDSGASNCSTADCGGTDGGACTFTQGFATPSSIVEISLLNQMPIVNSNTPNNNTDVDTYDVSIINGITVPISIEPTNGTWGGEEAPYTCGIPGSGLPRAPLGECTWDPTASGAYPLPSYQYIWVAYNASADSCSAEGPCGASGEVCGTSYDGTNVHPGFCGAPLGYWTADELCGKDPSNTIIGNCTQTPPVLSPPQPYLPSGATYSDLYQCANDLKNSCYTAGASEGNCCGCQDWDQLSPPITIPSTTTGLTTSCNGINNEYWSESSSSLPLLKWLKETCPTAYVYPFDDKSSTFTCQTLDDQNVNITNYTVTFCPLTAAK